MINRRYFFLWAPVWTCRSPAVQHGLDGGRRCAMPRRHSGTGRGRLRSSGRGCPRVAAPIANPRKRAHRHLQELRKVVQPTRDTFGDRRSHCRPQACARFNQHSLDQNCVHSRPLRRASSRRPSTSGTRHCQFQNLKKRRMLASEFSFCLAAFPSKHGPCNCDPLLTSRVHRRSRGEVMTQKPALKEPGWGIPGILSTVKTGRGEVAFSREMHANATSPAGVLRLPRHTLTCHRTPAFDYLRA